MTGESLEASSLQLLKEMQLCLAGVLNSLGGKSGAGLFEHYLFYSSAHANRAAEGFIVLRSSGRIDASKHFVRPAIEIMFKQQAVLNSKHRLSFRERYAMIFLIQGVFLFVPFRAYINHNYNITTM